MYRNCAIYDRLDRLAIELYCDYGFNKFPLDVQEVCNKLGLMLVPYSAYIASERELLKKRSVYGFLQPLSATAPATIYVNDDLTEVHSKGIIRKTIYHEIKHFVCGDKDDADDDLAEHFGKYFPCPIPHLIVNGINSPNEIVSRFAVDMSDACSIASQLCNRRTRYGSHIFDYEKPLIKLLDPVYYQIYLERQDEAEMRWGS